MCSSRNARRRRRQANRRKRDKYAPSRPVAGTALGVVGTATVLMLVPPASHGLHKYRPSAAPTAEMWPSSPDSPHTPNDVPLSSYADPIVTVGTISASHWQVWPNIYGD